MDKLPDFYKSLEKENDKTEWVRLINDNPTEAIKTYHDAFCVDDAKSKGYCDLLQLFRLLGTLEERKASSMDIKDINKKIGEISTTQQTEQKQHEYQLNKIVEEMKKLQNTAVSAAGTVAPGSTSDTVDREGLEKIHNALSVLDEKIESKSKQPTQQSSDTSNQEELERLKKQIAEFDKKKKQEIETLINKHLQALKESNSTVEDINKAKKELEKRLQEMNRSTSALDDEKNRRIENISMSNEENIAKINQLKQELEYAQAKHKAEIEELRKSTTNRVDNIEPAALSAEEPGTAPAEGDINTNEKISCDDEKGTINAAFGIKLFNLYETAKDILHSDMLILIGCLHFYKLGKLTITQGRETEKILTDLEKSLFIQLTKEEYEIITSKLLYINTTLNETFIKICERDTIYKNDKNKAGMAIMVYALLWIFHIDTSKRILADKPLYQQMVSNKSLFYTGSSFITPDNCAVMIKIKTKIQDSIINLKTIKDFIETDDFNSTLETLKINYARILKENKSVLALLKRRNDWGDDVSKQHKRFNLDIAGQDTIESPLELTYNDTPLVIPESTQGEPQNMTHKYNFYGFDSVYNHETNNFNIASNLVDNFNFENDTRPLCFIGYGQSGSGKTSTLIYLDVPGKEQDGIIMELLKKLKPDEVTVSMIEIYEAEAAKASDESCIGIGTTKHSTPGKIVECNASKTDESKHNDEAQPVQNGGAVKERIKVEGFTPISAEIKQGKQPIKPSMRYITIGEVLDKQFDEKGKSRSKNEEKDKDKDKETFTTFKKGSVDCPETEDNKDGWFYTHNESGDQCMDKNFGLKHYILMGFECREIAPTSNNKQSSRSHVVVSLELHWGSDSTQPPRYIYVCDLAGVENEFDCNTSGSADIIRMKAKTKANKNYSNIVGPGKIEDWKKLEEKRAGNIVKYVHKDVHISETEEGPTCWPDGTPNEAGDIDALRLEYSKELMRIFWHTHRTDESENTPMRIPDNEEGDLMRIKVKGKDTLIGFRTGITGDAVFEYFEEKLKKLPIKKDKDGRIEGIDKVKKNIEEFFESSWMNRLVNGITSSSSSTATPLSKDKLDEMKWDTWKTMRYTGVSAAKDIDLLKSAFNPIEMPDCKSSYEAGFKRACDIRTKEGYVINNTLAQLTRDVKRISKYAIKERLEKPTGKNTDDAEESSATYPCLFADTYDEYSKYSKSTHPLMNWYDIDDHLKEDFGSILTAMCLVSKHGKKTDWTIKEKLNLLKTFRFNYCTVLNETFMMRRGDDVAKTPAGNEIYVNNPPLPPYINVGILENSYKEYIFYENDPRTDEEYIEKKTNLFLTLCKHFLNLIVKMFRHPIYENDAIKFMQQLGSISNRPSIIFKSKEEIKELINDTPVINFLKPQIEEFINKIKTNNNATFIGTIQTTEQVNRVSDKIVISEALNSENPLNSIDDKNINRQLLKRLFHTSTAERGRETSAILYECLYEIRKLYNQAGLPIASKTMKERDIDGMVSAIETAFPLMSRYLDPKKINYNWNLISHMERGESVMKNKPLEIYGETGGEYNSYPYSGDNLTQKGGGRQIGTNQRKRMNAQKIKIRNDASTRLGLEEDGTSKTILIDSSFIPAKPRNALSKFNEILINNLKDEPSLEYIKSKEVWDKAKSNDKTKSFFPTEIIKNGDTFRRLTGIKKTKISLMQYLVTDDFFAAVYADYISQTFEKNTWNEDNRTFTDFTPVKTAEAREQLSKKLSNNDYDVQKSYPPENTVQRGGADGEEDGDETGEITTDMVVKQINTIGEKIESLGGIDQSEREKHAQDLAKINDAVTELQTHLTKLYSGEDSISTKLQEALQQLERVNTETSSAEN